MAQKRRRKRTSVPHRKEALQKRRKSADRPADLTIFLIGAVLIVCLAVLFGAGLKERLAGVARQAENTANTLPGTPKPYVYEIRLSGRKSEASPTPEPAVVETAAYSAPRVLIYHTHATEAYTMTPLYTYRETTEWRTKEKGKSVVAIGRLLAEALRSYGIAVLHDETNHEPPKLSTAYSRSEITMKTYRALYPSIELYIDVHRDAYGKEDGIHDVVVLDGTEVARLMFVVGTGEGATGTGFSDMPDYESNLALATALTEALASVDPGLIRPVRIKTGRYNQHISSRCALVEVGHNANTLEQALSAVPYLAKAIADELNQNGAASSAAPQDQSVWVPMD